MTLLKDVCHESLAETSAQFENAHLVHLSLAAYTSMWSAQRQPKMQTSCISNDIIDSEPNGRGGGSHEPAMSQAPDSRQATASKRALFCSIIVPTRT